MSRLYDVLAAGSLGDAIGYQVEFMTWQSIQTMHGIYGVQGLSDRPQATDDTQMMLFVTEGLINAIDEVDRVTGVAFAEPDKPMVSDFTEHTSKTLDDWYSTQENQPIPTSMFKHSPELMNRRAPGMTCLASLKEAREGGCFGNFAANNSKGCGAVMRAAPYAFLKGYTPSEIWEIAAEGGRLTHGHKEGWGSGSALAYLLHRMLLGEGIDDAVTFTIEESLRNGLDTTPSMMKTATHLAKHPKVLGPMQIQHHLGEGWTGDEALAIGLYAALRGKTVFEAILIATNHSGDSDSTAMIAGHISAMIHGLTEGERRMIGQVDLAAAVIKAAEKFESVL